MVYSNARQTTHCVLYQFALFIFKTFHDIHMASSFAQINCHPLEEPEENEKKTNTKPALFAFQLNESMDYPNSQSEGICQSDYFLEYYK